MNRTTSQAITFRRPFTLIGIEGYQPAGTYTVEIDEELIEGLSFAAYRRTDTRITLPASSSRPGITETVSIDPATVEAALQEQFNDQ